MDGLAMREHFLSKIAKKNAHFGANDSGSTDFGEGLAPTIFEIEAFFTCVL